MPSRCLIRLGIESDLRYISHLDTLRVIERLTARANVAVRYSEGFNPRPQMSLPAPRPVGVAALADPLVLTFDDPPRLEAVLERLGAHAPEGMTFGEGVLLDGKPPRPVSADYRLDGPPGPAAAENARRLADSVTWPIERRVKDKKRKGQWKRRRMDLRPLIASVRVNGESIEFQLVRQGDAWARPGEVLAALGLDEQADLVRLTRTAVTLESEQT